MPYRYLYMHHHTWPKATGITSMSSHFRRASLSSVAKAMAACLSGFSKSMMDWICGWREMRRYILLVQHTRQSSHWILQFIRVRPFFLSPLVFAHIQVIMIPTKSHLLVVFTCFTFAFNFFLVVLFVQVVVEYFLWSPKTPDASLAAAPAIKVRREWGKGDNEKQIIDSNRSYSEVSQVSSQSTKPDSPTHFYHYHALSFFKKKQIYGSLIRQLHISRKTCPNQEVRAPKPSAFAGKALGLGHQNAWGTMDSYGFIWIHMDSFPKSSESGSHFGTDMNWACGPGAPGFLRAKCKFAVTKSVTIALPWLALAFEKEYINTIVGKMRKNEKSFRQHALLCLFSSAGNPFKSHPNLLCLALGRVGGWTGGVGPDGLQRTISFWVVESTLCIIIILGLYVFKALLWQARVLYLRDPPEWTWMYLWRFEKQERATHRNSESTSKANRTWVVWLALLALAAKSLRPKARSTFLALLALPASLAPALVALVLVALIFFLGLVELAEVVSELTEQVALDALAWA